MRSKNIRSYYVFATTSCTNTNVARKILSLSLNSIGGLKIIYKQLVFMVESVIKHRKMMRADLFRSVD